MAASLTKTGATFVRMGEIGVALNMEEMIGMALALTTEGMIGGRTETSVPREIMITVDTADPGLVVEATRRAALEAVVLITGVAEAAVIPETDTDHLGVGMTAGGPLMILDEARHTVFRTIPRRLMASLSPPWLTCCHPRRLHPLRHPRVLRA